MEIKTINICFFFLCCWEKIPVWQSRILVAIVFPVLRYSALTSQYFRCHCFSCFGYLLRHHFVCDFLFDIWTPIFLLYVSMTSRLWFNHLGCIQPKRPLHILLKLQIQVIEMLQPHPLQILERLSGNQEWKVGLQSSSYCTCCSTMSIFPCSGNTSITNSIFLCWWS